MESSDRESLLLVGEGDFSFSMAYHKQSPYKMITSSTLLSTDELCQLHKHAQHNVSILQSHGVKVLYGVDATKLEEHPDLDGKAYSTIMFNFPHVGGKSNIKKNRKLLKDFFASAVQKIIAEGDIVVTLAQGQGGTPADRPIREWHDSWQVVGAATYSNMVLREATPFDTDSFPEYSSTGFRSEDRSFFTKRSMSYRFDKVPAYTPSPTAHTLKPVAVSIDNKTYHISSYLSHRFNRKLLQLADHPLNHTLQNLSSIMKTNENLANIVHLPEQHPIICLTENDLHNDSRYHLRECSKLTVDEATASVGTGNQPDVCVNQMEAVQEDNHTDCSSDITVGLRACLLEQLEELLPHDISPGTLYTNAGEVYRRPPCGSGNVAVQHELMALMLASAECNLVQFKGIMKKCIEELLGNHVQVLDSPAVINSHCGDVKLQDSHQLEVAYQSHNLHSLFSCNQVNPTGPVSAKNVTYDSKITKHSQEVGYLGTLLPNLPLTKQFNNELMVFVLNLDSMGQIKFDIPDQRCFWTKDPLFSSQFSPLPSDEPCTFIPLSFYPPLWRHDLSFWENPKETFDERKLIDIIHEVAQDTVSQILLMNVWTEPGTGKISRCYREIYQSVDKAISHTVAHDIQNAVRLTVEQKMGVELR